MMPTITIPPGPAYLINRIPQIFGPIVIVYLILSTLTSQNLFPFSPSSFLSSTAAKLILAVLSLPLSTALRIAYKDYENHRRAHSLGAELPPRYRTKRWGGLDLIQDIVAQYKFGYIGGPTRILTDAVDSNTVIFRTLFEDRITTTEPEHIKMMLATQFENFIKGTQDQGILECLLGNGIFSVDGDLWRFHRSTARPFFSKDRITDFENFDRHSQVAFDILQARLSEGFAVDMQDLASRYTMDSATRYLFSEDVQSLFAPLPYPPTLSTSHSPTNATTSHSSDVFCRAFTLGQELVVQRSAKGMSWPLWEFWNDHVKEQRDELSRYIEPILERALEKKKLSFRGEMEAKSDGEPVSPTKPQEWDSMLDYLIDRTEDKSLIMDTILNMLVAGRDTTACLLTFSLYMLAEHPKIVDRLRREILEFVGPDKAPTFEEIKDMKLLRAVLNETLRLYPPVPENGRKPVTSTVFPSKEAGRKDVFIPADVRVTYNVLLMQRRKDLWGPDALEFDPDRWLDDRLKRYFTPNPFIFTPFHAGPRICLGQQFAYHETSFFLIRFLQRFQNLVHHPELQRPEDRPPAEWKNQFEGPQGRDTIWPKSGLTMYSKGGLWMTMDPLSKDL